MQKLLAALTALLLFLTAGCGEKPNNPPPAPGHDHAAHATAADLPPAALDRSPLRPRDGKTLKILTGFFPLYVMTVNVAGGIDGVAVTNLTKPQTGCLHDYQLTTEDMKKIAGADIFIANGGGMENFLARATATNRELRVVTATDGIDLLTDDGAVNPHVWLSPTDAAREVANIVRALRAMDPAHAAAYEANGRRYIDRLAKLNVDIKTKLSGLKHRDIVTMHEAFAYFARDFDLRIAAVIRREPGEEPTPKELEQTIAVVKKLPVRVVCVEPQYSPAAAETIARAADAAIILLDPCVTGEADPNQADSYIAAMTQNAARLAETLQ